MTRVAFFGYSEIGYACLKVLLEHDIKPVVVFTHEDDPKENIWFHSVEEIARCSGLDVEVLPADDCAVQVDLIISAYYRKLIPMSFVMQAKYGAWNIHGSLLPKYRGRCPINWAIIHGERITGVTLHKITEVPDGGPIIDVEEVVIGKRSTAMDLTWDMVGASKRVLERNIERLMDGSEFLMEEQDESKATYCGKRTPEDGKIDWNWTTRQVYNMVRAVTKPWPGATAYLPCGKRIRIWKAEPLPPTDHDPGTLVCADPIIIATSDGAIQIVEYEPV